jgi:hypothetical protein
MKYPTFKMAALLLTAPIPTLYAAENQGTNPFEIGFPGTSLSAANQYLLPPCDEIKLGDPASLVSTPVPIESVLEPITFIPGTERVPLKMSINNAFQALCDRIPDRTPEGEQITPPEYIKLFIGQVSGTGAIFDDALKDAWTANGFYISWLDHAIQIVRIIHTLLTENFNDENAEILFNEFKLNVSGTASNIHFLFCSDRLSRFLFTQHARGIYVGRNSLFISNQPNGNDALINRFDAVPKETLPTNVAKFPFVVELSTSRKKPRIKNPKISTAEPYKDISNPGAGKKHNHNRRPNHR